MLRGAAVLPRRALQLYIRVTQASLPGTADAAVGASGQTGWKSDRAVEAEEVAAWIGRAVRAHFGDQAPAVQLVDRLSANALATSRTISIRRRARHTDRDLTQRLHHEAYTQVATSINGKAQTKLPILAASHPDTTRTQAGLVAFAEVISGSIDLDRL